MYKSLIRKILFQFDPEKIHHFSFSMIKGMMKVPLIPGITKSIFKVEDPRLEKKLFGLTFKNPVGLAAGFDKNALLFDEFSNYGFGFIEVGTVTPKPQPGNPKKRIFRLKADEALINRMGFNNHGLEEAVERLTENKNNLQKQLTEKPVIEDENFLARSYWQIEVDTAKDLLKNSAPIFGDNFESTFSDYAKDGKTARESLLNLDDKDLVNLLEKDDTLAANIAASLIVTRFNTEEA